ncbi:MAG: ribosome maturation factor RimM [Muribaculaceae bacterium]|nr:ribosome maturation factor RimM [Muribaculaceae bacterium]
MILRDDIIEIGRYNKPHGVNGEISASIDVDIDVLGSFSCLVSDIDGIFVPFFVEAMRPKGASTALLTIDGIASEVEAALLVNKDIYVLKSEYESLSDEEDCDELPIDYFIGFKMVADDGTEIGTIADVDDATENVLFIVERPDGDEVQIPAADDFIVSLDIDAKVMEMNLPMGLLEL